MALLRKIAVLWICSEVLGAKPAARAKIVLQPHQQQVVEDLRKHPDKKGLVLYHHFGSGKTITSLAVAEKLTKDTVLILVPSHLQVHWQNEMKKYQVVNPARYQIIDFSDVGELQKLGSLQGKMVILDESHRFIDRVRHATGGAAEVYTELYEKLQKQASRVLSLSGSLVYGDAIDLSFQINMVRGTTLLPVSLKEFQRSFMRPRPLPSFFRGHLLESIYMPNLAVTNIGMFMAAGFLKDPEEISRAVTASLLGGTLSPGLLRSQFPLAETPLTQFSFERLRDSVGYISFYEGARGGAQIKDYPSVEEKHRQVVLGSLAVQFWYKFVDGALSPECVAILLKDLTDGALLPQNKMQLRVDHFQKVLRDELGGGRQIGNLGFKDVEKGVRVEPQKFVQLSALLAAAKGPAVIYSHYPFNGIKRIQFFLTQRFPNKKIAELSASHSLKQQAATLAAYNKGELDILLLHPEMSEGISLNGTEQLHILEPSENYALSEQIKGRVVRYRSHAHLPEARRVVNIFHWTAVWSSVEEMIQKRAHWGVYNREFNYYSPATASYDLNESFKQIAPDTKALVTRRFNQTIDTRLRELLYSSQAK